MGGHADLAHVHVVIPVRSISGGKARLGGGLDAEEREALVLGMFRHTVRTVAEWRGADTVYAVSYDVAVLDEAIRYGLVAVRQIRGGLNEAVVQGRSAAIASGATAVLVLLADLPALTVDALTLLVDMAETAIATCYTRPLVVLAPAARRAGTNGLLMSPPDAIEPTFGPSSLEAHIESAACAGATLRLAVDDSLSFDLDTLDDVNRLGAATVAWLTELGSEPAGWDGCVALPNRSRPFEPP